jgi:hypothetical protein
VTLLRHYHAADPLFHRCWVDVQAVSGADFFFPGGRFCHGWVFSSRHYSHFYFWAVWNRIF